VRIKTSLLLLALLWPLFSVDKRIPNAPALGTEQPAFRPAAALSLSYDGRLALFASANRELVAHDTNHAADIFAWDRETGQIRLVSVSPQGTPGNRLSYHPDLSADGRFAAFASLADNLAPGDTNATSDVFLHNLSTGQTRLISSAPEGGSGSGWSGWPALSADGSVLAFWSRAQNLTEGDDEGGADIFMHETQTGRTQRVPPPLEAGPSTGLPYRPALSADGRYVAFVYTKGTVVFGSASHLNGSSEVRVYDTLTGRTSLLPLSQGIKVVPHSLSLSADGREIAFTAWEEGVFSIYIFDRPQEKLIPVPGSQARRASSLGFSLSASGEALVFLSAESSPPGQVFFYRTETGQVEGLTDAPPGTAPIRPALSSDQRFVAFATLPPDGNGVGFTLYDRGEDPRPRASLSGWVSDGLGHPVAGVLVEDSLGHQAKTGPDGSFRLAGLFTGGYTLSLSRAGFVFAPPSRRVLAAPGVPGSAGLAFTALPLGVVEAARADIGMPYSMNRGCPSPFRSCGGPFSGFYRGACTDIVLDAFLNGADFNIQIALETDFKKHPDHYYHLRNARTAEDMWRYFTYVRQRLPHDQPYLPGDIVFFDWEGDGVMDHVSLVSQVDARGRPQAMIDATGQITDNPHGLASELIWEDYHESHVTGHARWTGTIRLDEQLPDSGLPILLVSLDSPVAGLRLIDPQGIVVAAGEPHFPGSAIREIGSARIISLNRELKEGETYTIEISSPVDAPYQLGLQIVQGGNVTAAGSYTQAITAGDMLQIQFTITMENGQLSFQAPNLE
jgi:Tol biopolymer transport system component